jgi:putative transposase
MQVIKHQFQDEAQLAGFTTVEELNTAFWAWGDLCYNKKVHSQTGMSPDERFLSGFKKDQRSDHRRVTNLAWFNSLFLWQESRTVTKYGKVKLYSNEYPVTKVPPGKVVKVLFDPFNLTSLYIVDQKNQLLEKTSPHKKVNARVPNIPEEKKESRKVSKDSRDFFARLRERYMEMQKDDKRIDFSAFNKTQNKEDDNE